MKRSKLFAFALLLFSVFFLVLSQPSFLFEDGLSFFAWIAYIPFFFLLDLISLKKSFLWGGLYGFFSYALMCPWLSSFGFLALLFVCFLFAFYNSILFFLVSWSKKMFPARLEKYFWLFRVFILLSVEFLRTHGIFAFSYGIIGYSQWKNPLFLNFSAYFGVFGLSFLIISFNSLAEKFIFERFQNLPKQVGEKNFIHFRSLSFLFIFPAVSILFYFLPSSSIENSKSSSLKVALIQNASSAASSSIYDYQRDVALLKKLTDEALDFQKQTELVVWAETAVVPDILGGLAGRGDLLRQRLSRELFEYFESRHVSFLIGTNHADEDGVHNAALYFSGKSGEVLVYHKNRLVPFTEFWPDFLDFKFLDPVKKSLNCEFFARGKSIRSFPIKNMTFAVPICFEDSFSPLIRKMKESGADFFVNISDDAWSSSEAARNMHLSMSAFRCAEYASPMIRSTIDGKTCLLDCKGSLRAQIDSGRDGFLCAGLQLPEKAKTLYMLTGDWPLIFICLFTLLFLLILSLQFVKVRIYGRR